MLALAAPSPSPTTPRPSPSPPPTTINPWVARSLWIIGAVLIVLSIPALGSKAAFATLMTLGCACVLAGVIVWAVSRKNAKSTVCENTTAAPAATAVPPAAAYSTVTGVALADTAPIYLPTRSLSTPPPSPSASPLRSILRSPGALTTAATAAAAAASPSPSPSPAPNNGRRYRRHQRKHANDNDNDSDSDSDSNSDSDSDSDDDDNEPRQQRRRRRHSVQWADSTADGSTAIARVREFDNTEPPAATGRPSTPDTIVPDHAPKRVPALPPVQRTVLAYESAMNVAIPELDAADFASVYGPDGGPVQSQAAGPVFYSPPSRYITVDQLATERERFLSRPDTPELDRKRRTSALREFASIMKPDRDGTLIPIAIPVPGIPDAAAAAAVPIPV